MRNVATLALVGAIMAGCGTLPSMDAEPDYPKSFPKLASPSGDCPDLGGPYSNQGVQHNPISSLEAAVVLTRDVLKLADTFEDSDAIRLSFDEQSTPGVFGVRKSLVLRVTGRSGREWQSPTGRAVCSKGAFVYILSEVAGAALIGFGRSNEPVKFSIAVDGTLIVKRHHQDAGIIGFIPYRSSSNIYYYRFPLAQDRR